MMNLEKSVRLCLLMAGLLIALFFFASNNEPDDVVQESASILFLGDVYPGDSYLKRKGDKNILKKKGFEYPFGNFRTMLNNSDFTFANLETPVCDKDLSPVRRKKYVHWTDRDQVPALLRRLRINAVSLANNHSMDYSVDGLQQSIEALQKQGILYAGAGNNEVESLRPILKDFNIGDQQFKLAIIAGYEFNKNNERKHEWFSKKTRPGVQALSYVFLEEIRKFKKDKPEYFLIISPHWGGNYKWRQSIQVEMAHAWMDAGADMVIGHGTHMMQEIEYYKNRWIIYNIGNFIMNAPGAYKKKKVIAYSLIVKFNLTGKPDQLEKFIKIYPIFTDNKITNYKPRFVTQNEFNTSFQLLISRGGKSAKKLKSCKTGKDDHGYYFKLQIK